VAALACLGSTAWPAPERALLAVLALRTCLQLGRSGPDDGRTVVLRRGSDGGWWIGPIGRPTGPWRLQRAAFLPGAGAWLQFEGDGWPCRLWVSPRRLDRRLRRQLALTVGPAFSLSATAGRSAAASIGGIGDSHHENRS
jgi:hypothetical protein